MFSSLRRTLPFALPVVGVFVVCGALQARPINLVNQGRSPYAIYHDARTTSSVKQAAQELQRVLALSTGVKLAIVEAPRSPMICLGDNAESRRAGFSSDAIPDEGFRIVTKGKNLYILGKDWPDNDKKWAGCDSTGTRNGVYAFLERAVGVRWLLPGPWGEDIPSHKNQLVMEATDFADAPVVRQRWLMYIQNDHPDVRTWTVRNRLGGSIKVATGHNDLESLIPVFKQHPEYMALQPDGTRLRIPEARAAGVYSVPKFCFSNPDFTQAVADDLCQVFAKNPRQGTESLSATDGGGWCTCSNCKKGYRTVGLEWAEVGPVGESYTLTMLNYFNAVARDVGRKYPDCVLGALAYGATMIPPSDAIRLEPNVHIQLASPGYGYKLYKPERMRAARKLISGWAAVAPSLGWSDYSTWMRNAFGAPLPPGLPILKTVYPAFGNSIRTVFYSGYDAWGYGGVLNYVVARLMWNNKADPEAIYREFLDRAYGPAAPQLEKIYAIVDERLQQFIIAERTPDHELWYDSVVRIYMPIYAEIERLYGQASKQTLTEAQRKRLEMFGDNLVVFHYNLRQAGLLKDVDRSPLYRTDEQFVEFEKQNAHSLALTDLEVYRKNRWQTRLWSPEVRRLNIKPLRARMAAPKTDGELADPAWRGVAVADQFRLNADNRQPAGRQTTVGAVYDKMNLYVAFLCQEEAPEKLVADCKIANSRSILRDDYVSIFLQAGANRGLRLTVNPANTSYFQDEKPHPVTTATKVREDGWMVEMAIPWSMFGLSGPPVGQTWRGNFARSSRNPVPPQVSTWCRVEEKVSSPQAFGELHFAK